jgi:GNAT superfamily N-acetyltransferase
VIEYCTAITDEQAHELAQFAVVGLQAHRYPLHVSGAKVAAVVELFRRGAPHFGMVAVQDGRIVGAIAALVSEMLFFERCEAHVVMCRAVVPGVGRHLIRAVRDWARDDMRIRRVLFPIEEGADPRIARLLARYGFDRGQPNAIFYKG